MAVRRFLATTSLAILLASCSADPPGQSVRFLVTAPALPPESRLFLTGGGESLGNWTPRAVPLMPLDSNRWTVTVTVARGTHVRYMITRGSWNAEELDHRGPQYNAVRDVTVSGDTTIHCTVSRWIDRDGGVTFLRWTDITENNGFWIMDGWRYHPGDDIAWSAPDAIDTTWEIVNTALNSDNMPGAGWNGSGWFRLHLTIDSSLSDMPLAFRMWHGGASETYLDGRLLFSHGTVGPDQETEDVEHAGRNPEIMTFGSRPEHLLALRYSNHGNRSLHRTDRPSPGVAMRLDDVPGIINTILDSPLRPMMFAGMFLALTFVHLALFFFSPQFRENLFYAICTFAIGVLSFVNYHIRQLVGSYEIAFFDRIAQDAQIIAVLSGLFMVYWLAHGRIPRRALWFVLPAVGLLAWAHIDLTNLYTRFKDGFTILAQIEMFGHFFIVWKARRDIQDAWIVGAGFTVLAITVLHDVAYGQNLIGPVGGFRDTYMFGALAFGIAMSVVLSRRFARTNRDLQTQLGQVRELSEKTIAAEREAREAEIERRVLEADNARKTRELEDARHLQRSILPSRVPEFPHLDIAVHSDTATEVGGDYYDFYVGDDGGVTIALGDATGHGTTAGMMVVITKSLFDRYAHLRDLRDIFERTTADIRRLNLGPIYMAMQLVRINGNQIVAASAGMPFPLIYRAAGGTVESLPLKGMPLGGFTGFPYEIRETRLCPGDTIVLMSDGFSELFNEEKEVFGEERTQEIVGRAGGKAPAEVIRDLLCAGDRWSNGRRRDDDVTLVAIRMKHTDGTQRPAATPA